MHRTRYNAVRLDLEIVPRGPLLIKAGGYSANPSLPDMQFVRTHHPDHGETVYLPGSSLKGVVRGFTEKVLRTVNDTTSWRWACATFPDDAESCARKLSQETNTWAVYQKSCGSCRLFGHTRLRGRIAFSDFFPVEEVRTEVRHSVAISRLSHAVANGPFETEAVVAGTFHGRVIIENYELWQIALLSLALEAMHHGLLKIGFGKNRGFGEVEALVRETIVDEIAPAPAGLRGLGAFVSEEHVQAYGLTAPHALSDAPEPVQTERLGFYLRRRYDAERWAVVARRMMDGLSA